MTVSFHVQPDEHRLISAIAERAFRLYRDLGIYGMDRMTIEMDITAVHANGCPLDLSRLYAADDSNFSHDIGGINRHLDRDTGQLMDCFVPRFAKPERH